MAPWQFTIRSLLAAFVVVGLACVALLNANEWLASAVWSIVFLILITACLAAIYRQGETRAFFLGFAVAGGALLVFDFHSRSTGYALLTDKATNAAYLLLPESRQQGPTDPFGDEGENRMGVTRQSFRNVGRAFFELAVAWLGGFIARWLYVTRPKY